MGGETVEALSLARTYWRMMSKRAMEVNDEKRECPLIRLQLDMGTAFRSLLCT